MRALVTGAAGFIGVRLVEALQRRGDDVAVFTRSSSSALNISPSGRGVGVRVALAPPALRDIRTSCAAEIGEEENYGLPRARPLPAEEGTLRIHRGDLTNPQTLVGTCTGIDVVFHLAGYAHAEDANDLSAADIHRKVTVEGTRALLHEASRSGVKRFVFVSSVKAMGEGSVACLDENSLPRPTTAYGKAKRAAEELVIAASHAGMEICILRLPLVYGSSSKGNIARLMRAIDRGRFPPLPKLSNKRSMVHVDDVVQALLLVAERKEAVGQIYIVNDSKVYSTRDIYSAICRALGRRVPGWAIPVSVLKLGARVGDLVARLSGKPFPLNSSAVEKLTGSAWYSSAKLSREVGFRPRHTLETALPDIVASYRKQSADVA